MQDCEGKNFLDYCFVCKTQTVWNVVECKDGIDTVQCKKCGLVHHEPCPSN